MKRNEGAAGYFKLAKILKDRLGDKQSCTAIVDDGERLMRSIWMFVARLLGDRGTKAVLSRSLQLAALDAPLLQQVQVRGGALDFGEFRVYIAKTDCVPSEVLDAFLRLGAIIFQTLSDLSGDAITGPLISHLEDEP